MKTAHLLLWEYHIPLDFSSCLSDPLSETHLLAPLPLPGYTSELCTPIFNCPLDTQVLEGQLVAREMIPLSGGYLQKSGQQMMVAMDMERSVLTQEMFRRKSYLDLVIDRGGRGWK